MVVLVCVWSGEDWFVRHVDSSALDDDSEVFDDSFHARARLKVTRDSVTGEADRRGIVWVRQVNAVDADTCASSTD
jgi:hypothetical protein